MPWFNTLPRPGEFGRRFVPADADLQDWAIVGPLITDLQRRPLTTEADVRRWMGDYDEVLSCVKEEHQRLRGAREYDEADTAAAERLTRFDRDVWDRSTGMFYLLAQRYLSCPHRPRDSVAAAYERHQRQNLLEFGPERAAVRRAAEPFRRRWDELESTRSTTPWGRRTVNRSTGGSAGPEGGADREAAFRASAARAAEDRPARDRIVSEGAIAVDAEARRAGFANYVDAALAFDRRGEVSTVELLQVQAMTERRAVPIVRGLDERRRLLLGRAAPLPWDPPELPPAVDGRFAEPAALTDAARRILAAVDPDFADVFDRMRQHGLLDVDDRPGKARTCHCYTLAELRLPRTFLNPAGRDSVLSILLHEAGHAYHGWVSRGQPYYDLRHGTPHEADEFASQAMVLLCLDQLGLAVGGERATEECRAQLEGLVRSQVAQVARDAPHLWLWTRPGDAPDERAAAWRALDARLGRTTDWTGLDDLHAAAVEPSPFTWGGPSPYTLSWAAAFQLWLAYRRDPRETLGRYKRALALGGSVPLRDVYRTAGVELDVSPRVMDPVFDELESVLEW